jgi:hypothetical protein
MKKIIITILTISSFSSCISDKVIFRQEKFANIGNLKISQVIRLERLSKDITPDNLIEIDTGVYPNKKNYNLNYTKYYQSQSPPNYRLQTLYYSTLPDSSVKVILYSFDYNLNGFEDDKTLPKKQKEFQRKFEKLIKELSTRLGPPTVKYIEEGKISVDSTFRNDVKWLNPNGIKAYLYMFGTPEGYRQINLAIYKN